MPRRATGLVLALIAVVPAVLIPVLAVAADTPRSGLELPVTATDLLAKPSNNSPILLADPADPSFVLLANRLDGPDFGCALQVSGDAGRHWVSARPVKQLPAGVEKCYAPEIAFDGKGRLYYLFIGLQGAGNGPAGAFITSSTDRGLTFSPPRRVLGPGRYGVRMAIDPDIAPTGRIHLVWIETAGDQPTGGFAAPPNPIMAAYSDDGGKTMSRPVQVDDGGGRRVVAPVLALGPRHRVHVGYYDLGRDARDYEGLDGPTWDQPWSLIVSTSNDAGRSFGRGSLVDAGIVPPERVMLIYTMPPASLVADRLGRLYAAWHDARNHDWDAFVSVSGDGGRSWGRPHRVNDDRLGNGHHQYLPRLSVAPGGRLDIVFYDRRRDVANRGTDVYFTSSRDHAKTFAPNLRLTRVSFDSQVGPQYGVVSARGRHEFGARLALLSTPKAALAAWTDTRNTFRAPPAQDIYATTVDVASASGTSRLPAALLVVAGVAGAGALARRSIIHRLRGHSEPEMGAP